MTFKRSTSIPQSSHFDTEKLLIIGGIPQKQEVQKWFQIHGVPNCTQELIVGLLLLADATENRRSTARAQFVVSHQISFYFFYEDAQNKKGSVTMCRKLSEPTSSIHLIQPIYPVHSLVFLQSSL